tara:strand:- start:241 stop:2703 length:2463 start_codon:yes stop_codon:yes gene_type:complete
MRLLLHFFAIYLISFISIAQNLKSPSEFLGYEIGTEFSRHNQVVDYFEYVSEKMDENVILKYYGETYERRPLMYAVLSSKKNINEIEKIRLANLEVLEEKPSKLNDKAIVWLSYNVHGNESSSIEASMQTLFNLLTKNYDLLENTIVIIDPCLNPDGRDRYANWYNQMRTIPYTTNKISREHREPWPGGRANHYLFDLNRDWAWLTQIESELRLKEYQKWLPHVHVDFHEQGIDEPYYFAPAAEPYHEVITGWQRDFQAMIGNNNAKYFDKNGWLYFTKEFFDLLYPSYGDTYPTYLGAIGMTYEQAGGGIAGLGIINSEGKNLTLVDRIEHHTISGISTVETSSLNAKKLNNEFVKFFRYNDKKARNYILSGDNDKIEKLGKFLKKHKIDFFSTKKQKINAFSYNENKSVSYTTKQTDIVVPTSQSRRKLVDVLFERTTKLSDSVTYDITAWSLPYVYGLNAYLTEKEVEKFDYKINAKVNSIDKNAIAYASVWNEIDDAKFLSSLLINNIKVRYNKKDIQTGELFLSKGSMIIYKGDQIIEDFEDILFKEAKNFNIKLSSIYSGISISGPDLGSDSVKLIKNKKIAILSGDDNQNSVSSLNYGSIWHFFEQELRYPLTHINIKDFKRVSLDEFDVLIIPDGYYGSIGNESNLIKIKSWINKGGNIIAFENAIKIFSDKEGFSVKSKKEKESKKEKVNFEDVYRNNIQNYLAGAIFKVKIDETHPLAFGYDKEYYSLKTSTSTYELLDNGYNVGKIENLKDNIIGFVGDKIKTKFKNSLIFGHEKIGRGNIVYLVDNVMFRSFWENGKMFLVNSVFYIN